MDANRGRRMERGESSAAGGRNGVNRRQNEETNEDEFGEVSVHTSDTNTIVGEEPIHEET